MKKETLKEEWREKLSKNPSLGQLNLAIPIGGYVRVGDFIDKKELENIADWWLAKNAEHDALLLRRLEEMKKETYQTNKNMIYDTKEVGYNQALEDIKLLITDKEV